MRIRFYQILSLILLTGIWHFITLDNHFAFYLGRPYDVVMQLGKWFYSGEIYPHLAITLTETIVAFMVGSLLGALTGIWFALSPTLGAVMNPLLNAANAMPRVILAPIFGVWFGLGMGSKIALAITLVFFVTFFVVRQGIRATPPILITNAKLLGANRWQLLYAIYLPSAMVWLFSSLHTSVGLAYVGAVVGEYLGSYAGVGYLILQAEGVLDINTIIAGVIVLTACALTLDGLISLIERRFLRWLPQHHVGQTTAQSYHPH
ncbi:MAG: ABC transporter permease [Ottowia sp.]|nr:ABC transporter permease [Ottowia sp.]